MYTNIVHNNFHTDDSEENAKKEETEGPLVANNKREKISEDQIVCEVDSYLEAAVSLSSLADVRVIM